MWKIFLKMLKKQKKKIFLVTNAHLKVLDLKFKKNRDRKIF